MIVEPTCDAERPGNEPGGILPEDLTKFRHWLDRCDELSRNSDDPDTRVGCIIVDPSEEVRSEGWNSLPRNVRPEPSRLQRPAKYAWIEHAERNAIFLAAKAGTPLDGCTLYVPLLPCSECARGIIQAGIREVVISARRMDMYAGERYREDHVVANKMLSEAGVTVYSI